MRQKTQKGDVYSFAIVMQEVILRVPPFSMLGKETEGLSNGHFLSNIFLFKFKEEYLLNRRSEQDSQTSSTL